MPAQSGDKIYAERSGIPGLLTAQEIADLKEAATVAQGVKADSAVQSLQAGTNITIDNTDPQSPIISSTTSGGGGSSIPEAPIDNDSYARRNGEWIVIPRFLTYVTIANKTKNNDVTWVNDDELISETLIPNALYRIELLLMTQADAATDFAFRIARNGLSDAILRVAGDLDNAASTTFTWTNQQNIGGAGATAIRMGNYIGYLKTGANVGNIAIQWRQQTLGAGNTTLAANSMLMLRRVQ